jgi:hypothetical protein
MIEKWDRASNTTAYAFTRDNKRKTTAQSRARYTHPMQDSDIWRAALAHMEQYGDQVPVFAAMEADARLEAGDLDGAGQWRMALRAIREMMKPEGVRH